MRAGRISAAVLLACCAGVSAAPAALAAGEGRPHPGPTAEVPVGTLRNGLRGITGPHSAEAVGGAALIGAAGLLATRRRTPARAAGAAGER